MKHLSKLEIEHVAGGEYIILPPLPSPYPNPYPFPSPDDPAPSPWPVFDQAI